MGGTSVADVAGLQRHRHGLAVAAALEGREELQHGLPAADGEQVMHPVRLTPHNRFWLKKEAFFQGGVFWKRQMRENREKLM